MALYNFPYYRKGDTFSGVEFTVTVNNTPLVLTGATIRMDLRETPLGTLVKSFYSPDGGITISSPSTAGKFIIDKQVIDIPAYKYYYDIQILLETGEIHTYIWGFFEVKQDITYD